ncbi:hypothetical protein [Larkinella rosea]|uniref:Uncharacterized protein n=1 Tax=Larkinella rosea TaxID=2025312 RepID=A0A3P1BMN9_9BACT|nr:hypothetical protein [Larkinella rosea]RRB02331.1 hypothetical protein EHT25_17835 [Larkinella rosea]
MFYLARLTNNNRGYKEPSGPNYKSENATSSRTAFEATYGFGFEEWFRNERHSYEGYQYAYIEGLTSDLNPEIPILLYTLRFAENGKGSAKKLVVGVLKEWQPIAQWDGELPAEVISEWHEEMKAELGNLLESVAPEKRSAALKQLLAHSQYPEKPKPLFNVRFKMDQLDYRVAKVIDASPFGKNNSFAFELKTLDSYDAKTQKVLTDLGLN